MEGFFCNFQGMSGIAKTASDSTLGVIRKESWILDHFEIFVNIAWRRSALFECFSSLDPELRLDQCPTIDGG